MAYGYTYTLSTITGSHTDQAVALIHTPAGRQDFPSAAIDGGVSSIDNGGGPLRAYTDSSKTTRLPVHVVSFVAGGTPSAEVWVKLPSVYTGATIYIEADAVETTQPAVTNAYGRNAVYAGPRFHLEDEVDSSGLTVNLDLQSQSSAAAQLGNGVDVDSNYLLGDDDNSALDFSAVSGYHIGAWLDLDSYASQAAWVGIISKGNSTDNDWAIQRSSSSTDLRIYHGNSGYTVSGAFDDFCGIGKVKLDVTWDGTYVRIYKNGASLATVSAAGQPANHTTGSLKIGAARDGGKVTGIYDEVSIEKVYRSADWIATEYANQSASSAWGTVGTWADSGSGTNVSASVDTKTLTTYTASVANDINVASNTATKTLTTYSATVSTTANVEVGTQTATKTLTTYQANIANDISIASGISSKTITTYAANIALGKNVDASVVNKTLTTYTSDITVNVNVPSNTDTKTFTTYAATISVVDNNVDVNANTATLNLVTYSATIDKYIQQSVNRQFIGKSSYRAFAGNTSNRSFTGSGSNRSFLGNI